MANLNWSGWLLFAWWLLFALSFIADCCRKHSDGKTVLGLAVLTTWLLWLVS